MVSPALYTVNNNFVTVASTGAIEMFVTWGAVVVANTLSSVPPGKLTRLYHYVYVYSP